MKKKISMLFEMLICINLYLGWIVVILFSVTILGLIINKGCINIDTPKIISILLMCSIIIGSSEYYLNYLREK